MRTTGTTAGAETAPGDDLTLFSCHFEHVSPGEFGERPLNEIPLITPKNNPRQALGLTGVLFFTEASAQSSSAFELIVTVELRVPVPNW